MPLLLNPGVALAISIYVGMLLDVFVGHENLARFQNRLWAALLGKSPVQQQSLQQVPALSGDVAPLFDLYLHYSDIQFAVGALQRKMLTLPALPEEGY